VPKNGGGCYGPRFERPQLVEDDNYREVSPLAARSLATRVSTWQPAVGNTAMAYAWPTGCA